MNYKTIDYLHIKDGRTFYAISTEGKRLKCTKIGIWGMRYKDKTLTITRYCPFNEEWTYEIADTTNNR